MPTLPSLNSIVLFFSLLSWVLPFGILPGCRVLPIDVTKTPPPSPLVSMLGEGNAVSMCESLRIPVLASSSFISFYFSLAAYSCSIQLFFLFLHALAFLAMSPPLACDPPLVFYFPIPTTAHSRDLVRELILAPVSHSRAFFQNDAARDSPFFFFTDSFVLFFILGLLWLYESSPYFPFPPGNLVATSTCGHHSCLSPLS